MDTEQLQRKELRTFCNATLNKVVKLLEKNLTPEEFDVLCQELDGGYYSMLAALNPINEQLKKAAIADLEDNPWIQWNGDEYGPFNDKSTVVEVELRCGVKDTAKVIDWSWKHYNEEDDIMRYRQVFLNDT